jgi:hypothetical protein
MNNAFNFGDLFASVGGMTVAVIACAAKLMLTHTGPRHVDPAFERERRFQVTSPHLRGEVGFYA